FAHLHGSRDLIAARLGERKGHFMPPTLLESQFATLEVSDDIPRFDIAAAPERVAADIIDRLQLGH
ncbi:MAG: gluconokinase, partial [Verrucomicrobiota bacterium]